MVTALLTLLTFIPAALLVGWLYGIGTPPSAVKSGPNDGLVHTVATTSVHLPELGTANLPGKWIADPIAKANLQDNLNTDGGNAQVLTVLISGNVVMWEASVVKFPSSQSSSNNPCTSTPTGNGTPTLGGKPAESTDIKQSCPDGTTYFRVYEMKDNGADLVLRITAPDSSTAIDEINSALLGMPGSNPGGVTIS